MRFGEYILFHSCVDKDTKVQAPVEIVIHEKLVDMIECMSTHCVSI